MSRGRKPIAADASSWRVEPLTLEIGARVDGASLSPPLSPEVRRRCLDLLDRYLVLFFPGQSISPDEQLTLGREFGELTVAPIGPKRADRPELSVWDFVAPKGVTDSWHVDNTFLATPPSVSILKALELPAVGGDTLWASMFAAYEALSPAMRAFLDPLIAVHTISKRVHQGYALGVVREDPAEAERTCPPVRHPVVRTHPTSGRRALYVNGNWTSHIEGLGREESAAVLRFCFEHVKRPDFQVRYHWTVDDIAIYDNSWVQHYAVPDYRERRLMHRVNVQGPVPA